MQGRFFAAFVICVFLSPVFAQERPNSSRYEGDARLTITVSALDWISVPYLFAGRSREGVDCSGFVQAVLESAGYGPVPRTAVSFAEFGVRVQGEPKPGDILLFYEDGEPEHVGIALGNEAFIHAASQGPATGVIISSLGEQWYKERFSHARDVISGGAK